MQSNVIGFTRLSANGMSALVPDLVEWFRLKGLTVSVVKRATDGFDLDQPGKRSYLLREVGAQEVFLVGSQRWVLMREYRDSTEPALESLLARLAPSDLVLVEGFRERAIPKIEAHRPSSSNSPMWPHDPSVVAVVSDTSIDTPLPVFDVGNLDQIGSFILTMAGLH